MLKTKKLEAEPQRHGEHRESFLLVKAKGYKRNRRDAEGAEKN
jgi:hypothetical protein